MNTNFKIKDARREAELNNPLEIEVYGYSSGSRNPYSTSSLISGDWELEDLPDGMPCMYEFMDEERYQESVLGETGEHADFDDWYGKKGKILVILIDLDYDNGLYWEFIF